MPPITLSTDFGPGSPYVAAMKGVILGINPAATIVDLTHAIPPQDVRQGGLFLAGVTHWFPADTIHVAVVDPGVGTKRRIIYARIGDQHYIAPDNGLLSRLTTRKQPLRVVSLDNSEHWLPEISATFHGRDIMAPVAAQISLGLNPEKLGARQPSLFQLNWPEPQVNPGGIAGTVLSIDSFGNLMTDIEQEHLRSVPAADLRIECGGEIIQGLARTYGEHSDGALVALIGSAGFLEIAVVRGSAARQLGAAVGAPVTLSW